MAYDDADPQADWFATDTETSAGIVELYQRVQAFADRTVADLPLEAVGRVAHWGEGEVTLHHVLVHTIVDLQRHAGHADILREQIDGTAGLLPGRDNMPGSIDWASYHDRLTTIADQFA